MIFRPTRRPGGSGMENRTMHGSERAARAARFGFGGAMQRFVMTGAAALGALALVAAAAQTPQATPMAGVAASPTAASPDLDIVTAGVRHVADLDLLVFDL